MLYVFHKFPCPIELLLLTLVGFGCMVVRPLLVLEPGKVIMSFDDALEWFERSII